MMTLQNKGVFPRARQVIKTPFYSPPSCSCGVTRVMGEDKTLQFAPLFHPSRDTKYHSQPTPVSRGCSLINCEHVGSVRELLRPVRMDWSTVKTDTTQSSRGLQTAPAKVSVGGHTQYSGEPTHQTGDMESGLAGGMPAPERGEVRS